MATMVCLVTPTFSASAAWVISPAWKRSVRMVLLIWAWPLPMMLADPVVDEPRDRVRHARGHQRREQKVGHGRRVAAEGEEQKKSEASERRHDVAVPAAPRRHDAVALVGLFVLELPAPGDADQDGRHDQCNDVDDDGGE